MKIAIIALTQKGAELALKMGCALKSDVYLKEGVYIASDGNASTVSRETSEKDEKMPPLHLFSNGIRKLVEKIFPLYQGLIFIMACGIVVRSIAPHLKSKTKDPAVVVVDEMGQFAISLLSGHLGGANRLSRKVSEITGGTPVITTATDIHHIIAFDVFAKDNDCAIEDISKLKYISAKLVNGGYVGFFSDCPIEGVLPPNLLKLKAGEVNCESVILSNRTDIPVSAESLLILRPRNLILGIGCKKGKSRSEINLAVMDFLATAGRSILSIKKVASINLKATEAGIVDFCKEKEIDFVTFPPEAIKAIEERFTLSEFVREVTGVGSVAEACAVLAGKNAKLICPKTIYSGITLALAEEERSYKIQ